MRLLTILLACAVPILASGDETLASKVVRIPLNQNDPAIVRLGTHGITTLEFPYKIEALDGFGFSASPSPDGQDLFQISFNKGTNFLSLKAMREGVEGNLTVVLDGKVYCLFCKAVPDPSFVVVFEDNSAKTISDPHDILEKNKQASPARLLGFLDKLKAYPSLKTSAPEIFQNMEVAEPNSESSLDGLKVTLRRVIRDEGLDSIGFEVELANQTNKDFLYDPESLGVRIGDEVYPQAVSDAGGLVQAGKRLPAFFVVAGTATGGRNDLAVTNKFDVMLRQITEGKNSKVPAIWQEPPDTVPTTQQGYQEAVLPAFQGEQTPRQVNGVADKKSRKSHERRKKSLKPSGEIQPPELVKKERSEDATAQPDE
jgi:hypothetical protein